MVALIILTIIALFVALFLKYSPQFGAPSEGERLVRVVRSPQWKGKKFENAPVALMHISFTETLGLLREMITGGKDRKPKKTLPSSQQTFDKASGAYLTWFGHSTFLYEIDGKKILFDPMLGKYASPVPFMVARYPYTLPASADALPPLDAVIISHDHYDHLDYGTIQILKDKVGRFIMPLGVGAHLARWGVPSEKIIELDWHEGIDMNGITVTSLPSQHFSGRSLSDRQKTLWSAWRIKSPTAHVFFGGDSGYFSGFKTIGEQYGPFDLTLIDSGQYDPRWGVVHMNPEQSVVAHKELKGKVFMPIHWSAFTLALHAWTDPAERAVVAAAKEGIDMVTPMIGERFEVLHERPQKTWWRDHV